MEDSEPKDGLDVQAASPAWRRTARALVLRSLVEQLSPRFEREVLRKHVDGAALDGGCLGTSLGTRQRGREPYQMP